MEVSLSGLSGSLESLFFSNSNFFSLAFGCSLSSLAVDNNNINGTIPPVITSLYSLQQLNLGVNMISGQIPDGLGSMTALRSIDFSVNRLTGPLPLSLCNTSSPLADLILISNQLTGVLNMSLCVNLIYLDVSKNQFNGTAIGPPPGDNNLHVVYLSDNQLSNVTDFVGSGLITALDVGQNPLADASLLRAVSRLQSLGSFSIANFDVNPPSYIVGSLPASMFSHTATIRSINWNNQFAVGKLPPIVGASVFTSLQTKNNFISGTIPASFVKAMANQNVLVDLRFNFLCCCSIGELIYWEGPSTNYSSFYISNLSLSQLENHPGLKSPNVSYASYNFSLPRLPPGLKLSKTLQPITEPVVSFNGSAAGSQINLGNRSYVGLNCPYLVREEDEDRQHNFLTGWFLDPEYTLFEGCQCDPGLVLVRSIERGGLLVVKCLLPPSPPEHWWVRYWWVFLIIGVVAFVILLLVIYKAASGSRPKILQELFNAQRRAKGPPLTGQISIVTTDIENFSSLMRNSPEAAMQAVILHNNLLQKAKFANFGYTIESEGDSFTILFESPVDAVKFCIQSQLLLISATWPKGLFAEQETSFDSSTPDIQRSENRNYSRRASLGLFGSIPFKSSYLLNDDMGKASPQGSLKPEESMMNVVKGQCGQGLRVRMGVATGTIESPTTPITSQVLQLAKLVGDAASGGQILMCSTTFHHTKDLTEDLGCVTDQGMDLKLLQSEKGGRWSFWQHKKERLDHEALLLHMGDYLHCPEESKIPTFLQPSDLDTSERLLSLYQVLPPKLLNRGRAFGDKLRLKPDWVKVDGGYFDAPGALGFPLGASDKSKDDVLDPFIATVFIQVDGGKAYAAKHRSDAAEVHSVLLALIKTTLRLVNPGGYLNKAQDNELKYLLTFSTTEAAIYWCAQLQLASVYALWPQSALKHWPEEKGIGENEGILLFRGPRIKMGLSEGPISRISADWTGRADVHGPSVNQAARFMDAASWGGQIAVEEEVATKAMGAMIEASLDFFSRSASEDVRLAGPGSCGMSSHGKDDVESAPSPLFVQEIHPEVSDEASLEIPPSPSSTHPGSSRPSKAVPSTVLIPPSSSTCQLNKLTKASWVLPDEQHLIRSDPMTLVSQRLGRFTFKGSDDDVLDMVNLTPSSLLTRPFPPDAPTGKGERVKIPTTQNQEVMRIELPNMMFIQELREQLLSNLAHVQLQARLTRSKSGDAKQVLGLSKSIKRGMFGRASSGLHPVTEECMEGSEYSGASRPPSHHPSLGQWARRDSQSTHASQA